MGNASFNRASRLRLLAFAAAAMANLAHAAIPDSERQALLNLYTSTNGAGWGTNTGWNGSAGTECSWYGITCDASNAHVQTIRLSLNHLTGSLPNLSGLTSLTVLDVSLNNPANDPTGQFGLAGSIPDLSALTALIDVYVYNNQLSGTIPNLPPNLTVFRARYNQLTGTIPDLSRLTNLSEFDVGGNQLSGGLPDLSRLANLTGFFAWGNRLTGTLQSISGLTQLQGLDVSGNQLTGTIPDLSKLTNLTAFSADGNQLTGTIPPLSALAKLTAINVGSNQLTGPIPDLSGLTALLEFDVNDNHLSGSIPALSSLTSLAVFNVTDNQLTGSMPSLAGLGSLQDVLVSNNRLTGAIVPVPNAGPGLWPGGSSLCPNLFSPLSDDPDWDTATGSNMWYTSCQSLPSVTIAASSVGANGAIAPAGNSYVPYGTTATFNVFVQPLFDARVTGTCGGVLSASSFTTYPVTSNCTVMVNFISDIVFNNGFE